MTDIKISALPAAAALTGSESVPVVQGGATVRTTVGAISSNPPPHTAFLVPTGGDDAQQINAAYVALNALGGGLIQLSGGAFKLTNTKIVPLDKVTIKGMGMGVTTIQQTVLGVRAFETSYTFVNQITYLAFEDFTVIGTWLTNQSLGGDNDRAFRINGVQRLEFQNVEVRYCRQMSLTGQYNNEVLVTGCRIIFSARDGINLSGSLRCVVTENHLTHINDDAIAIHQEAATNNPPIEGHVVDNNVLEDTFGIKVLGASKCSISNNTIRRPKGYGIYTHPGGTEGYSDQVAVDICNNTISDVVNANKFGGGNICTAMLIGNAIKFWAEPVVGGTPPVVTLPENLYYLSNAVGAQNAGAQGYNISGNTIMGFTLPGVGNYSGWGYGLAFTASGFQDPDMSTGFKFSQAGIRITDAMLTVRISDNVFEALSTPVSLDSNITAMKSLSIVGNTFKRFSSYGVNLAPAVQRYGVVEIKQNLFDGDPYFESANRTAGPDGTWSTGSPTPGAVNAANWAGASLSGNTFRNLNQVVNTNGGTQLDYQGNVYVYEPNAGDNTGTSNNSNKGIRRHDGFNDPVARMVWQDSTPTSLTYGQDVFRQGALAAAAIPSTGYYVKGQLVFCTDVTITGNPSYTLAGWRRLTTGNTHVLNVDWAECHSLNETLLMPALTLKGNNTNATAEAQDLTQAQVNTLLGSVLSSTDVQTFTVNGVWNKPGGTPKFVRVIMFAPGGGGGGGAMVASGTVASGGSGGGAGGAIDLFFDPATLNATENVAIGAVGTGGAGAAVAGAGTNGTNGGSSTFGTVPYMRCYGGGGGAGGQVASDSGGGGGAGFFGGGGTGSNVAGGNGGAGGGVGGGFGVGGSVNTVPGYGSSGGGGAQAAVGGAGGDQRNFLVPSGGGGGGGISATPTASSGTRGGLIQQGVSGGSSSPGGALGAAGGPTPTVIAYAAGCGGGGGSGTIAAAATAGAGAVGTRGGGGGGGGSCLTTSTAAGAGGNGGSGYCVVVTYF